jgi:hypothetical protein
MHTHTLSLYDFRRTSVCFKLGCAAANKRSCGLLLIADCILIRLHAVILLCDKSIVSRGARLFAAVKAQSSFLDRERGEKKTFFFLCM